MMKFSKYIKAFLLGVILYNSFNIKAQCPSINTFTYIGTNSDCPCTNAHLGIDFTDISTDTLYAVWNYGDGTIDTTLNSTSSHAQDDHAYTTAGVYTIWVKILGPGICVDSTSLVMNVTCHLMTDTCPTIPWFTYITTPVSASPCPFLEFNSGMCGTVSAKPTVVWDFGDGYSYTDTASAGTATNYQYGAPGTFTATITFYVPNGCVVSRTLEVVMECDPPPCYDCISSFAPEPGRKYLVSAWTKEDSPAQSKTSYTYPSIWIVYPSLNDSAGPFSPSGRIIDGWQRLEGAFTIPSSATDIKIKLNCSSGDDCYFDDIRVQPFDGSMKSFVYDPVNMRLVAELDERNYATLYEYDEEGKLTRVKKETEKGIMTIKESRNNSQKP